MKTNVQKWGNSLALRIPSSFAKQLGLKSACSVTLEIDHGQLVVRPDCLTLDTLLSDITPENLHHGVFEDGNPGIGNEAW